MTINDKIRDEKLQYDISKESSKLLVLSSGKIDKNQYLTGKKISSSDQSRIIKQAKLTNAVSGKILEK